MKCRYSRRTMMVRCILVDTTVPVRIRPRIETRPVKGHFLSVGDNEGQQTFDPFCAHCHSLHSLSSSPPGVVGCSPTRRSKRPTTREFIYKRMAWLCISRTDVLALNGSLGGTETQTDILVPPALSCIVSFRCGSSSPHPTRILLGHSHHPCRDAWSCSW